jgi:omega-hydroxy-beta-dihydromenaquinone-9 sulfotransferase
MASAETNVNKYPEWAPRFWHGMQSKTWFSYLARNGFRISPRRLHIAFGVSAFMPFSDSMALLHHLIFGRAIARTSLAGPPIFVLGHWRSGTTLLHEFLGLDGRYASPTTFQCFAPAHFLLTEMLVTKFGGWLLPDKRPMDNMKAGWSLPQEDEFALMNLGAPTLYARMMFPQNGFVDENTLSDGQFTDEQRMRWQYLMDWFLKALTYKSKKPLILKSPPHTGRIGLLRSMYPDAKFIHIARDPRKLYPSTMKLWRSLDAIQGLQAPVADDQLESFVFRSLRTMYQSYEKGKQGLAESQLIHVSYEELTQRPIAVMERIYQQLDLNGFDQVRDLLQTKTRNEREYRTNNFAMAPDLERRILTEWKDYAEQYGYA